MSNHLDENLTEIFKALSHPLRQDIIYLLAERQEIGGIGFTALQNELNRGSSRKKPVQVGTIYHHIGLLGELINQNDESKTWTLSERGLFAYNLLTSSQDRNQFLTNGDLKQSSPLLLIWKILAPPSIFFNIKKSITLFIGWQILFFLLFAFITAQADLVLIFLFFSDINLSKDILFSLGSIVLSWIIFTVLVLVLSRQLLPKKTMSLEDIVTTAIFLGLSMLPLGIFPLLVMARVIDLTQSFIPLALAILLQLWVILFSARAISVQFFVRMERAGIISLISIYIMVLLGVLLSPILGF
ncbi:MAG: helix-turn-helix transcriptional regulator [Candidatus Heimdallarchaeota archaeon]|nr:MAG: helix-turn-helix transcriptional regulator [Candidatus Heimdallarchaeota archaeon]